MITENNGFHDGEAFDHDGLAGYEDYVHDHVIVDHYGHHNMDEGEAGVGDEDVEREFVAGYDDVSDMESMNGGNNGSVVTASTMDGGVPLEQRGHGFLQQHRHNGTMDADEAHDEDADVTVTTNNDVVDNENNGDNGNETDGVASAKGELSSEGAKTVEQVKNQFEGSLKGIKQLVETLLTEMSDFVEQTEIVHRDFMQVQESVHKETERLNALEPDVERASMHMNMSLGGAVTEDDNGSGRASF